MKNPLKCPFKVFVYSAEMKIIIVSLLFAASLIDGNISRPRSLHSIQVDSDPIGGNFLYRVLEYPHIGSARQNVIRYPQAISQYPFGPQQVLYPGQPIFAYPGLVPQVPGISPPFISASRPPPSGSPSQVIVDEDTVAINAA